MAPEEQGPSSVGMHGYIVQFQLLNSQQAAAGEDFDINNCDDGEWQDWKRKIGPTSNGATLGKLK